MEFDPKTMYSELGVLGNTFENLTVTYVKTEMVDKAEQGDVTALYNLERVARYSEVSEVVTYARQQYQRITGTTPPSSTPTTPPVQGGEDSENEQGDS